MAPRGDFNRRETKKPKKSQSKKPVNLITTAPVPPPEVEVIRKGKIRKEEEEQ